MNIKINNNNISCKKGDTVLDAARKAGVDIPNLCHHPDFCAKANCRICLVEIKGRKGLFTSCSTKVEDGMEIFTDSPLVVKSRNINLGLIFAEHVEKCSSCVWRFECKLLKYANKYKILLTTFKDRKNNRGVEPVANAIEIDKTQCIDCRNCIDACKMQGIDCLNIKNKGSEQEVSFSKIKNCILCGQCTVHCPVSSAQEQTQYEKIETKISIKERVMIAQLDPTLEATLIENLKNNNINALKLVSVLKTIGFDYVFNLNTATDVSILSEAKELVKNLSVEKSTFPVFSSNCSAWINYIEHYRPDLISNVSTLRSPHILNGAIIKTFWARQKKINPKDITVVTIAPCTAKKYEAIRPEMKINGFFPVDHVLTTREFLFLIKKNNIKLNEIKDVEFDNLIEDDHKISNNKTQNRSIESILNSVYFILNKNSEKEFNSKKTINVNFSDLDGIRQAEVNIDGRKLKVAQVAGLGNLSAALDKYKDFHYIDVLSCPDGCMGGGGQPIPVSSDIRKERIDIAKNINSGKKSFNAFENLHAYTILNWLHDEGMDSFLYTYFEQKINYDNY